MIYKTNMLPVFDYGSIIFFYDNCSMLDKAQLSAVKIILGCIQTISSDDMLSDVQ